MIMDDPLENQYLIIPPCYIKEELDLSNIDDCSGEEMMDDDDDDDENKCDEPTETSDNVINKNVIADSAGINARENLPHDNLQKKPVNVGESKEVTVDSSKINGSISFMTKECDDTDVDVENDSLSSDGGSDVETDVLQTKRNIKRNGSDSSSDDFELKISDDSGDKAPSDEIDDFQNNKHVSSIEQDKLTSKETKSDIITKTYETRNKNKNLFPVEDVTSVNPKEVVNELEKSKSQIDAVNKITTRQSLKGNEISSEQSLKMNENHSKQSFKNVSSRKKKKLKKNIILYCIKCQSVDEFTTVNRKKYICLQCQSIMHYKCLLCDNKVCESYTGLYKHIRIHHIFKPNHKKLKKNKKVPRIKPANMYEPNLETQSVFLEPKNVYQPTLVLADIDKFTVLICSNCNDTNRIHDGKITVCEVCKINMGLTCLICGKYDATINGMYQHLHKEHQEHFPQDYEQTSNDNLNASSLLQNQNNEVSSNRPLVKGKKCLNCGKRFVNRSSAVSHSKYCSNAVYLPCGFCTFKTKYIANLKKHVERIHNMPFDKNVRNYNPTSDIVDNVSNYNPTSDIVDNVSNYNPTLDTANNVSNYNPAPITVKKTVRNRCPRCNKLFKASQRLKVHLKHCGLKPHLQCHFCHYKTKFNYNLKVHINHVHAASNKNTTRKIEKSKTSDIKDDINLSNIEEKNAFTQNGVLPVASVNKLRTQDMVNMYCSKCNEIRDVFHSFRALKCLKCTTLLIYQCKKCSKGYKGYTSVVYHVQNQCFKTYKQNKNEPTTKLSKPKKVVNTPKPNKILEEPKTSEPLKNLQKSGEETQEALLGKVSCPRCNAKVMNLKKHNRYCGMEANNKCPYCPYKSKYNYNLNTHLQNVHSLKKIKKKIIGVKKKKVARHGQSHRKLKVINPPREDQNKPISIKPPQEENPQGDLMEAYCFKCNKSQMALKHVSICEVCEFDLTFRCRECKRVLSSYHALQYHIHQHWGHYKCPKCSKLLNLDESVIRMHESTCKPKTNAE